MRESITFSKVSYEQFLEDCVRDGFTDVDMIKEAYENIKLPERATIGSAGHDFFAPFDIVMQRDEKKAFPTGIRVKMPENIVMLLVPRSSLGFKYGFQLSNTMGVIDSDYFHAENEGHIHCAAHYCYSAGTDWNEETEESYFYAEEKPLVIKQGQAYMQGIFVEYCIDTYDFTYKERNGGLGSTDEG